MFVFETYNGNEGSSNLKTISDKSHNFTTEIKNINEFMENIVHFLSIGADFCVIWLFRKDYQEYYINRKQKSLIIKSKIEKHISELKQNRKIIIKDVFNDSETLGLTEFADLYEHGIMVIEGTKNIKNIKSRWIIVNDYNAEDKEIRTAYAIGFIPYTKIVDFDTNPCNERSQNIFYCKYNNFTKWYSRNPYEKISYCIKYTHFYEEIADANYFKKPLEKYIFTCKNYLKFFYQLRFLKF